MKFVLSFQNLVVLFSCSSIGIIAGCSGGSAIDPMPSDRIEATANRDGSTYHLADDGNVYREISGGKEWTFHSQVFDPIHFKNSYVTEDKIVYRISPDDGRRFATIRSFQEDFEDLDLGIKGLLQLVSEPRMRWGSFTLQSPKAPSIEEYVDLRNKIMKSKAGFLDAKLEPIAENTHSGKRSLKFTTPPKTSSMVTCKSSLSSPLIYFRNGDDVWYEAWYLVQGEMP